MDAVLRQAGGGRETSVEDISNIPEMFFMRVLDNARLGGTGTAETTAADPLNLTEPSPIPTLAIAKLVKWWRRTQALCPPDVPTPPTQKCEVTTKAAEAPPDKGVKRNMDGGDRATR